MKRNKELDSLKIELARMRIETERLKQVSIKDAWGFVKKHED